MDEQGNEIGRIGAAIGVDFPHTQVSYGLLKSLAEGVKKTWDTAAMSVRMIGKMFTGDVSISNISGPVTIADYACSAGYSSFYFVFSVGFHQLGNFELVTDSHVGRRPPPVLFSRSSDW